MKKICIVMTLFCTLLLSELVVVASQNKNTRAPRPDALSFPGSTPEIVSPFDTAQLAQIQQCICQLKNLIESCCAISQIEIITTIIESGFDFIESQIEVLTELTESCCEHVESQLDTLTEITVSGLDFIESQLDALGACALISITDTGDVVISSPGTYCLENDVNSITITSSFVILDMNGHTARSMSITGSMLTPILYITVRNGFIYRTTAPVGINLDINFAQFVTISHINIDNTVGAGTTGINMANSTNVTLYDLTINRCGPAIVATEAENLLIERVEAFKSTGGTNGMNIQALIAVPNTITIRDSLISGFINGIDLVVTGPEHQINIVNCQMEDCAQHGLSAQLGSIYLDNVAVENCGQNGIQISLAQIQAYNCRTVNNGFHGFFMQNMQLAVIENCTSHTNGARGFHCFQGSVSMNNCIAIGNATDGFGFLSNGGVLHQCSAISNGGDGFNIQTTQPGVLSNCFATNNGGAGFNNVSGTMNMAYTGLSIVGNALDPDPNVQGEFNSFPFYWIEQHASTAKFWKNVALITGIFV